MLANATADCACPLYGRVVKQAPLLVLRVASFGCNHGVVPAERGTFEACD
jgi:hypothetical protein